MIPLPSTVIALAFNMPTMLILLALALLIFGSRLPSLGKNLGKGIVSFKKGLKEANADDEDDDDEDEDDDIEEAPRKKPKQIAAKGSETTARQKQKVAAGEDDDEA